LAIASEEGVVSLINGSEDSQFDLDHGRPSFQVHRNAIFDLAWSKDDRFIVRASLFYFKSRNQI
jgi:denticleless